MSHVTDDLELHAVQALSTERMAEVEAHLRTCASCRAVADEIADVVAALADAVPLREPPADLRDRILAAAKRDVPAPRSARPFRVSFDPRVLAMAAAFVLALGLTAETMRLQTVEAEKAEYERTLVGVALGGRTWYMAGIDEWKGMGGNLMQPASGQPAFVVFHDLRPLDEGKVYALWLIAPDGKWVRGTSFRPDGHKVQTVDVGQDLGGFSQCAVTVEASASGKRQGPLVMQSRIAPPSQ